MGSMKDHYGDAPAPETYPHRPGFKQGTTSRQAAERVSDAAGLRARVLVEIVASPGTADEIAARLGKSVLSIRPRVTELFKLGKIETAPHPSGIGPLSRPNASGRSALVWRQK